MKITVIFLLSLLIASCGNSRENSYTGSTPADAVVRTFLGISLVDSIDFIRWKLILGDNRYQLHCNYGISKPNTNGFVNGGKQVELNGNYKKENNYYQLQHNNKTLNILALNNNLLHLLDAGKRLLVGNGGWSYTLNNLSPSSTGEINLRTTQMAWKDSIAFVGRTPCDVPGIIPAGTTCYKLKWHIVLYDGEENRNKGRYKVFGTPWRKDRGRTGNLEITHGKNGKTIYRLNDDKGKGFVFLLQLDEHVLVFIDQEENLLVGDHYFSYTLNRVK